jgi:hypothetical protein
MVIILGGSGSSTVKVVGILTLSCSPSGSRASGAAPCGPSPALTCQLGLETENVTTKNTFILIFNQEGENSAIPPQTDKKKIERVQKLNFSFFCAFRWKVWFLFYFSSKMART